MLDNRLNVFLFLLFNIINSSSYCQEVCHITYGTDIAKPNNEWICLNGPSLWFSEDGLCWHKKYFPELDRPDHGYPTTIAFFNETDGIIATQDNPNFSNSKIFVTNDGGYSWKNQPYHLEDNCQIGLASYLLYVLDENTVIMTSIRFTGTFLLSKDRGVNWSCIDYNLKQEHIPDIDIVDKDSWYVLTDDGVVMTSDQGNTHQLIIPGDFLFLERNLNNNSFYAIGRDETGYIFYWIENETIVDRKYLKELILDIGFIYQFVVVDDVFYLFIDRNLYFSTDYGNSWTLSNLEYAERFGFSIRKVQNEIFTSRSRLLKLNCSNNEICDLETISDDVIAYPNPTKDVISFGTVNFDKVHIYDINGRLIESRTFEKGLNSQRRKINIKHLFSGVYFFVLESDDSILTKKVLKL